MCWHNYTQHSGCGHQGEVHDERYTLCDLAYTALLSKRGPSPPQDFNFFPQAPKRANTTISRLFPSLSRSDTAASTCSRRTVSGPESVGSNRASTMSGVSSQFPDHEMLPAAETCPNLETRVRVSNKPGQVCKECAKWIEHMQNMIEGYNKGRGVRGTAAFKEFLEERREYKERLGEL
ncbi:uncharacterized protein N0V89_007095 [Didymosphaeria variabile]|uniref:Uncharacterized protein n=1 Tax=Didymosphaeria variabile TaxID=1932322 RepID=A0A9W8XJ03_9PLEO|nr:uncharacterized protein N0V89_007095 [Didymosphaeria variabile]KAJ4351752.1 hypothetical protein N0V89_007095 [Didymosphaeria variabile]